MILRICFEVMSGGSEDGKVDDLGSSQKEFPEEMVMMSARSVRPLRGFHVVLYSVLLFPGQKSIWKTVIARAKLRVTQGVCKRIEYVTFSV